MSNLKYLKKKKKMKKILILCLRGSVGSREKEYRIC